MWKPPPAFEEKYIQRPSGDQAVVVHWPSGGPTGWPGADPSNGTRRHGSQLLPSISARSTDFPSGDRADRCAMLPWPRGKKVVRGSLRLSLDGTIPMCTPDIISAYIICLSSSQMRPEAFGRNGCGAP